MTRLTAAFLIASLSLIAGAASADDTSKDTGAKHEQLMKQCMAKQKADKSTTQTNDQMMKACMEQVKSGKPQLPKGKSTKESSEATPN